jgi:hypothetical protein
MLPIYNNDNKHYTPSFIIAKIYKKNEIDYRMKHDNKILAS